MFTLSKSLFFLLILTVIASFITYKLVVASYDSLESDRYSIENLKN
jgi:hypothetical protein